MTEVSLRNIWLVARREYLERVRSRSFLLSTFATPLLMAMFIVLPTMITRSATHALEGDHPLRLHIVLASNNAPLAGLIAGELTRRSPGRFEITMVTPASDRERSRLDEEVDASKIDGYLWIGDDALKKRQIEFTTHRVSDFLLLQRLNLATAYAFSAQRLVQYGVAPGDIAQALQPVEVHVVGTNDSETAFNLLRGAMVVLALVFIMFFSLLSYGVVVMRSVLEEKASRITEVLLCSTTAPELMTGKILGVGSVGLTQVAVWIAIGLAGAMRSLYLRTMLGVLEVSPLLLVYFVIFYVLGYLLYSTIFAAVGAAFNSVDEAQQWNFVIVLPLVAASALILPVATSVNSATSVVASIVPFSAPILMFERIAIQPPPVWQIALSMLSMLGAIGALLFVCGRIYRVGILMHGKRPTIRELSRWFRHA